MVRRDTSTAVERHALRPVDLERATASARRACRSSAGRAPRRDVGAGSSPTRAPATSASIRSTTSSTSRSRRVDLDRVRRRGACSRRRARRGAAGRSASASAPMPGALGVPARARGRRVGDELDLHLGVRARRRCRCRGPRSPTSPAWPSSRWRSRITSRTSGWRATTGTAASISGSRIAAVTSSPAIDTRAARRRSSTGFAARERLERGPVVERRRPRAARAR